MEIAIKTTGLELTASLKEYIGKKFKSLEKIIPNHENSRLNLEIARTTKHHHKGLVYYAEIMLYTPSKNILRAKAIDFDSRVALDKAKQEIENIVRKIRTKQETKTRAGVRKLKSGDSE